MNDTFLRACRGEKVEHTPVWLMRQAGRYLPEYQEVRARAGDFLTLCKTPEMAAEVTIQPVDILGVDAAILFSDILVIPEAMGMPLKFHEGLGPKLENPVRDRGGLDSLKRVNAEDDLSYVLETIALLRRRLEDRVPLIGFSGAPFTLLTYMVEGGSSKNFLETKKMMYQDPELFELLMTRISESVVNYMRAQARAGAQALQLFDSWAGALAPDDYRTLVLPHVKRIVEEVKKEGVPVISFVNGAAGLLEDMPGAGADVYGFDWRVSMKRAAEVLGANASVQGNLDPLALFLSEEAMKLKIERILEDAKAARGHIFNLGHGIFPEAPIEGAKTFVRLVHDLSRS